MVGQVLSSTLNIGSIPIFGAKQNKMKSETRGAKRKPESEKIKFISIGVKQKNIDKYKGVEGLKLFIEMKLNLKA